MFSLGESMANFNVLLIEDDDVDIINIQRAFKKNNFSYPLIICKDGYEAYELLKSNSIQRPIVILLDLNMPRMNGIEFLTKLRIDDKWHDLPVVILTTSDEESDKLKSYNLHVAGYIKKPVSFDDFAKVIFSFGNYWDKIEFPFKKVIYG